MSNYACVVNCDPCCNDAQFGKGLKDWPCTSSYSFLTVASLTTGYSASVATISIIWYSIPVKCSTTWIIQNICEEFFSAAEESAGADKMCISPWSERTSRDNFPLCLHLPGCELWLASQIGVFMTEQVGRLQLSENAQHHISAINQRELENRRLKRLGEWTTNQDNEGTKM